jgi:poly(3-hydroxybutyrate) depolymerase
MSYSSKTDNGLIFGMAVRTTLRCLTTLAALAALPPAYAAWNSSQEGIFNHPTWIYTPSSTLSSGKRGLLVVLHGCAQTNSDLKTFGNLVPTAEAKGLVMAVPSVGSNYWGTDAQRCWDYDNGTDGRHHVAEVTDLTKALVARGSLNVDPDQVYIVGLSSGAALSLLLGCSAPDLFAGVGAIAGPSVGSSQSMALLNAFSIPSTNVTNAISRCNALAGNKASLLTTQVTNIAYGDMDKDGPDARYTYLPGSTSHPGQYALVSTKWSQDNVSVLEAIYGTGALGTPTAVQGGAGAEQNAMVGSQIRLGALVIHNVGHAWPAGTGQPNSASSGGVWLAQSGLNYPQYIAEWLMQHNVRAGRPQVTVNIPTISGATLTVTGTTTDNGQIVRVDTTLLQADSSGSFQQAAGHPQIASAAGAFSDSYFNLATGWYKVRVTATNDANRTTERTTSEVAVGSPGPLWQCAQHTASNFGHVQAGRAYDNGGFAHAVGSNQKMGLNNLFYTTVLAQTAINYYVIGNCP